MWISRFLVVVACSSLLLAQRAPVEAAWELLARGERKQAVSRLREIIRNNPADADSRLLLGSVLAEDGDRMGSIEQLTAAVQLRPQSAETHNALGEAYSGFGQKKAARAEFDKSAMLDPSFAQAQVNLGQVLVEAGEFAAAAQPLDRALKLLGATPDAAYPHYLRAKVFSEQNEVPKAVAHLQKAVALRPDFAEAWSDLGQARKALGDDTGALSAFEKAVAAGPNDAVAQYRLGAEYLHQGKARDAVLHLQIANRSNPEDQATLYTLQTALRQNGQVQEANEAKRKLTDLLRMRDEAAQKALLAVQLNNQGAELEKSGNLRGALEKYRSALELNPEHVGFRVNFAAALLHLGQWDQGITELRDAVRRDPENGTLKAALGRALAQAPVKR